MNWLSNINFAKKLLNCDVKRAKILAIAFQKQKIIAIAANQVVIGSKKRWTNHAEESLLNKLRKIKAKERLGKIDVIVIRWNAKAKWVMAKPCKKCFNKLNNYGIRNIFYSDMNGEILKYEN